MGIKNVLCDLDGTLTDSELGITNCIRYALKALARPDMSAEELRWTVGPPIHLSFATLLDTSDERLIQQGVEFYRERYDTLGWAENSVYDGMPAALAELRAAGLRLFVATSKPQVFAKRILTHFELAGYFEAIYGSGLDGTRANKGELIAYLVQQEGLNVDECLMIGDRKHDVLGAKANGMECLGVTYGYGSEEELLRAGAVAVASHPRDWAPYVCGLTGTL